MTADMRISWAAGGRAFAQDGMQMQTPGRGNPSSPGSPGSLWRVSSNAIFSRAEDAMHH